MRLLPGRKVISTVVHMYWYNISENLSSHLQVIGTENHLSIHVVLVSISHFSQHYFMPQGSYPHNRTAA